MSLFHVKKAQKRDNELVRCERHVCCAPQHAATGWRRPCVPPFHCPGLLKHAYLMSQQSSTYLTSHWQLTRCVVLYA